MSNINRDLKVKVLVVGDPGVGKSSLAHLIATGEPTKNPGYTIGCSTQIKVSFFFDNFKYSPKSIFSCTNLSREL